MTDGPAARAATRLVLLALAGLALGAVLGVVWEAVWSPPRGVAYQGRWYLEGTGLEHDVTATAWFAVIGLAGGVGYGLLAARSSGPREVVTLAGVCLGSVLAVWAMVQVGHLLGPPDPREVAQRAEDYEPIPGDLRVATAEQGSQLLGLDSSAYLAIPAGALMGLVVVFLGAPGRRPLDSVG